MAFVQVPKDLNQIKPKVALGLTKRQLVCFTPGIILFIIVYALIYRFIDTTIALVVCMFLAGPFVIAGIWSKNNLFMEEYVATYLRSTYWYPVKRYKKGMKGGSQFEKKENKQKDKKSKNNKK